MAADHLLGGSALVADGAGTTVQRPRDGEQRRARVALGAGQQADHAAPVLVALGAGPRQQRAHLGVLQGFDGRGGRAQADRHQLHRPRVPGPRIDQQAGLVRAEGHREIGAQRRPGDLPGVGVHPARQVDRDEHAAARLARVRLGGRPQPAGAADPDDAVQDQVGAAELGQARPLIDRQPTTRRPQRGQRGPVRTLGAEQHRGHRRPAPGQAGAGEERVATVVAAAREHQHPAAVDPAATAGQQPGAGGGEAGHRPVHQRLAGEFRLGGPDLGDGVS